MSWPTVDDGRESLVFCLPDRTPVYTHVAFGLIALLVGAAALPWIGWARQATPSQPPARQVASVIQFKKRGGRL